MKILKNSIFNFNASHRFVAIVYVIVSMNISTTQFVFVARDFICTIKKNEDVKKESRFSCQKMKAIFELLLLTPS